jgi:hypothetical protein
VTATVWRVKRKVFVHAAGIELRSLAYETRMVPQDHSLPVHCTNSAILCTALSFSLSLSPIAALRYGLLAAVRFKKNLWRCVVRVLVVKKVEVRIVHLGVISSFSPFDKVLKNSRMRSGRYQTQQFFGYLNHSVNKMLYDERITPRTEVRLSLLATFFLKTIYFFSSCSTTNGDERRFTVLSQILIDSDNLVCNPARN